MRLTADEVARLLHAERAGAGWIACCPAHNDRNPSLAIAEGEEGQLLLFCHAGCAFSDVLAAIRAKCGAGPALHPPPRARVLRRKADASERRKLSQALWGAAQSAGGTLVEAYLRSRGVFLPAGSDLRFAPALRHLSGVVAPAMVGAVRDREGAMMGVHRTWLRPDGAGKAGLSPQKAMLGRAAGGAVRLAHQGAPLIVAEGIENALSALAVMPDASAWAALSAHGLSALELPEIAGDLFIAADNGDVGLKAAAALGARAEALGWSVEERVPPPGVDWNDILRELRNGKR